MNLPGRSSDAGPDNYEIDPETGCTPFEMQADIERWHLLRAKIKRALKGGKDAK